MVMYRSRRLMFDTNILFDLLDEHRPECEEAWQVIVLCNGGGDMGMVSPMSLKDVYYTLGKAGPEKLARDSVRTLMGLLVIAPFGAEECDLALNSDEPDFEDGLIRACAELNDADAILTRDEAAFKGSRVPAMPCSEYLRRYGGDA